MDSRLSRNGRNKLNELRAIGIEPTLDEIVLLHELGKRVDNPSDSERLDLIGRPARAGNAWLWPFTVMSGVWYSDRALPWFKDSPAVCTYALAFALAHGRGDPVPDVARRPWSERIVRGLLGIHETRTLADLVDMDETLSAIVAWRDRLTCTRDEIEAAINEVIAPDEPGEAKPCEQRSANWGQIVHELAMLTGTDPDYWQKRTSMDTLVSSYITAREIYRARATGALPNLRQTALDDAIKALQSAFAAILKRHQEGGPT